MPLVVNSTPLSSSCNSYVSLAEMLDYVSTRSADRDLVDTWSDLDTEVKALTLVNATRTLDGLMEWVGQRYSRDQRLKWPRVNAYVDGFHVPSTTFPRPVVEATCELALWMMTNGGVTSLDQTSQLDSVKVGPIEIDFNQSIMGSAKSFFPDSLAIILRDYGSLIQPAIPGSNSIRMVRLERA